MVLQSFIYTAPNLQRHQWKSCLSWSAEALHSSFPTLRGQRSSTEDPGGGINAEENSAVNLQFMRSSSAGDILEAVSFIKDGKMEGIEVLFEVKLWDLGNVLQELIVS